MLLDVALKDWRSFVATSWGPGTPFDDRRDGQAIWDAAMTGPTEYPYMGRMGGEQGEQLQHDVRSGSWKQQMYRLRKEPPPASSPHWFTVDAFVKLIEAHEVQV